MAIQQQEQQAAKTVEPTAPKLTKEQASALAKQTPEQAGIGAFSQYLRRSMPAIKNIASRELNPERLYRMVIAAVSRTPLLAKCTMESILNATQQASELGLTVGSATGEGYFVPYKMNLEPDRNRPARWGYVCQFIPGYRGLISLAFRSGHVKSVRAKSVFQGDKFNYKDGLNFVLEHTPAFDGPRDPKDITFAWCVVELKDGGFLIDVMPRSEIDAVRKRSKASDSGPWVTDFAEMAKKSVTRRCLKYAPMSAEMSKALAADESFESGDVSALAEFDFVDVIDVEPEPVETKTEKVRDKIAPVENEQVGEAWPAGVFGDHDAKLMALGMPYKEASDWNAAGVTEGQVKLALTTGKGDLDKVRAALEQAVQQ